jgi:hypothetical protein
MYVLIMYVMQTHNEHSGSENENQQGQLARMRETSENEHGGRWVQMTGSYSCEHKCGWGGAVNGVRCEPGWIESVQAHRDDGASDERQQHNSSGSYSCAWGQVRTRAE